MKRKAFVICCNDSIEFVVLNDEEKAKKKIKELENEFLKNLNHYDMFDDNYYWHYHECKY